MTPEKAEQLETRPANDPIAPLAHAIVRAIKEIRTRRPRCFRAGCGAMATTIVTRDETVHAYCRTCAETIRLDQRVQLLRATRAAMRVSNGGCHAR